jgi:hypothetical protein
MLLPDVTGDPVSDDGVPFGKEVRHSRPIGHHGPSTPPITSIIHFAQAAAPITWRPANRRSLHLTAPCIFEPTRRPHGHQARPSV